MLCTLPYQVYQLTRSRNYSNKKFIIWKVCMSIMTQSQQCFKGQLDRYNGVIVNSIQEPCESSIFPQRLKASIQEWVKSKKNTIWFYVHLNQADWIPFLVKDDFKFHHALNEYVTLYRWLSDKVCNIPPYAHTNIGIGAFVFNEKTQEILVIKEKRAIRSMWKLPGGYMEPKEYIDQTIEREIMEETGIQAKFKCLIAFRHTHEHTFGCSDIYMIAHLTPSTYDIKNCTQEISECVWMKLEEYAEYSEVHDSNRFFARKMLEHLKSGIGIDVTCGIHPFTQKPVYTYSISKMNNN